jgi:subtilisin family serine protease
MASGNAPDLWLKGNEPGKLTVGKKVSDALNVWLVQYDTTSMAAAEMLRWVRSRPEVKAAQWNYYDSGRSAIQPFNLIPNDPRFNLQWQYVNTGANNGLADADLDADQAWDITTGGLTPAGDTIVVAVIDAGISPGHPDLYQNLWHNREEIPGDGIDNDQNGYTDDYNGWNVVTHTDDIEGTGTSHGTPVSAVIGARGNNGVGVTGVNWKVKIMFVAGGNTIAGILSAYDYILRSRLRYNETFGASGAFIVAVNCSFGVNYGQPSDAPLWCAAFDTLGSAGILSVAATANEGINVDVQGDLPTTCPSDYLIAVTSLDKSDHKPSNAAWGQQNIDLGSYGEGIYTAAAGNGNLYDYAYGTSFAAPHVTGAVGLLYSAPCPGLISLAKIKPADAALWAKSLVLNSATPIQALQNLTQTGGRLNLYKMLDSYQGQCSLCPAPFALVAKNITKTGASLTWSGTPAFTSVRLRWRKIGNPDWIVVDNVVSPYILDNLSICTGYEYETLSFCSLGLSSSWSDPFQFKTDGCCVPPTGVGSVAIFKTAAAITWNAVAAAGHYRLRIRKSGGNWNIQETNGTTLLFSGLEPCTSYEAQVQTVCANTVQTDFSASCFFETKGCGACLDANYCQAAGQFATSEWIKSFSIDSIHLILNGTASSGYLDLSATLDTLPILTAGNVYYLQFKPAFTGTPRKEFTRLFIDYNGDGTFSPDELAFTSGYPTADAVSKNLTVPDNIVPGRTRARILMKYTTDASQAPGSCETFDFGQVQDFCLKLQKPVSASPELPGHSTELKIWPNPADTYFNLSLNDAQPGTYFVQVLGADGRRALSGEIQLPGRLSTLDWPAGIYLIQVNDIRSAAGYHGIFVRK